MTSLNQMGEKSTEVDASVSPLRVVVKTLILIALANLIFALLNPVSFISRLSLYNYAFPGRMRLPYGDDPRLSNNLNLNQMDAMFASHEIQGEGKQTDGFKVVVLGDSSVWGFLQAPDETLASRLNEKGLVSNDGRKVRFYNLGYPTLSLTKDLLILEEALNYEPDLVLWFITLESLPLAKQLESPLLTFNPERTLSLLARTGIQLNEANLALQLPSLLEKSIIGRRRLLADLYRHQLYGVLWSATGVDQDIPATYNLRTEDLDEDVSFQGMNPDRLQRSMLGFDIIRAGMEISEVPIVLINEPIFVSGGENSDIRYNFYYPIWAYDDYRRILTEAAEKNDWMLIDLWDALPGDVFTDSAIHYNLEGVERVIHHLLHAQRLPFGIPD